MLQLRIIVLFFIAITNTCFTCRGNKSIKDYLVKWFAKENKLETNRLILRKISIGDSNDLFEYFSDQEVHEHLATMPYKSIANVEKFIVSIQEKYKHGELALTIELKEQKKVIGTIYLPINHSEERGEIGFVLNKKYWGQGFILEATRKLVEFGFNILQLNRIQATCKAENKRCQRVLQKLHMHHEGTLKKYRKDFKFPNTFIDAQMWGILQEDFLKLKTVSEINH